MIIAMLVGVVGIGGAIVLYSSLYSGTTSSATEEVPTNDSLQQIGNKTSPKLLLIVLESNEDFSRAVDEYPANNSEAIHLSIGQHIRFDSSDYRSPDGIKVLAKNVDNGSKDVLRKSYNVNNEFFVTLKKGVYQIEVETKWFELGSFVYTFNVVLG